MHPHSITSRISAITIALLSAIILPCRATILVHDTWLDNTRSDPAAPVYSENGVDSDTDGDLESAWFQGGGGTLAPVAAGGPLRGIGYGTSSASWTTYFKPANSAVTLSGTGDQLK